MLPLQSVETLETTLMKTSLMLSAAALGLVAAQGISAQAAKAQEAVLLTDGNMLVHVDLSNGMGSEPVAISGAEGDILGIDVRPANGTLYAVGADNHLYTIDPESGAAMKGAMLQETFPAGGYATVDFNPVADRLRLMHSDGTNFRVNVETGEVAVDGSLAFADNDMHAGETPMVTAGAYTNSFAGTEATALYDIDATISGLLLQSPPNDGVLQAVGKLGVEVEPTVAFDIYSETADENHPILVAGGSAYSVDLESGAATEMTALPEIDGTVIDIAIMSAR